MDLGDLGELIPLILLAAYYLFRPSKKNQEKRDAPQQRSKPKSTRTLEDIMRELMGEEQRQESFDPEPESEPEVTQDLEEEYSDYMEENPYAAYTGEVDDAKKKTIITDRVTLSGDHKKAKNEIEVDLRQAVIYDAILNRPYD